jgi:hypothetical protein
MKDDRESNPKPNDEGKSNDSPPITGRIRIEPEDNPGIGGPNDPGASDPPAGNTTLSDF